MREMDSMLQKNMLIPIKQQQLKKLKKFLPLLRKNNIKPPLSRRGFFYTYNNIMGQLNSKQYISPKEEERDTENLMNLYSKICPTIGKFYFDNYIKPIIKKDYPQFLMIHAKLSPEARRLMRRVGYLMQPNPSDQTVYLTDLGIEVKKCGGHYKYLKIKEKEKEQKKLKEKAEYETIIFKNKYKIINLLLKPLGFIKSLFT